jgi:hypothetical protein
MIVSLNANTSDDPDSLNHPSHLVAGNVITAANVTAATSNNPAPALDQYSRSTAVNITSPPQADPKCSESVPAPSEELMLEAADASAIPHDYDDSNSTLDYPPRSIVTSDGSPLPRRRWQLIAETGYPALRRGSNRRRRC